MRTLHVGLRVGDRERSSAFYRALGYVVVGEVPSAPIGHLTMLRLPDDEFVTLELVDAGGDVEPGGFSHLVVQVEDLRATVVRLAEAGIDADAPSSPDGSEDFLTCWLTDPDGYRVELVQWPAGHAVGMSEADFAG